MIYAHYVVSLVRDLRQDIIFRMKAVKNQNTLASIAVSLFLISVLYAIFLVEIPQLVNIIQQDKQTLAVSARCRRFCKNYSSKKGDTTMFEKTKAKLKEWQHYVDGDADSPYEFFMLFVILVNTASLGLETSKNISEEFKNILFYADQICLCIFIIELLFKFLVYNKEFFGEFRTDDGKKYFHLNKWNISDLLIVVVSIFASLPYFAVFRVFRLLRSFKIIRAIRSLRIIKALKLVNDISSLRTTFKGLVKAIPDILWTFCFLLVFAYVYAIVGTNVFAEEFPQYFGNLGTSMLTLCQITTFDSWFSGIARPVIQVYSWAWVYFISYAFIAASVIMNVLVVIIVDSMGKVREKERAEKRKRRQQAQEITLEKLSQQIADLQKQIEAYTRENNGCQETEE